MVDGVYLKPEPLTGRLEGCKFEASLGYTLQVQQRLDYLRDELVGVSEDSIILVKGQTLEKCKQKAT